MTAGNNRSNSNRRAGSQTASINHEVPFKSSMSFLALSAFVWPLATLLHYFHQEAYYESTSSSNNYPRYLQEENNVPSLFAPNISSAPSRAPIGQCDVDTREYTVSTWEQITPTLIIASAVCFICLLGYELFRRDPIVGKYVYDRKRLTQPGRSPPPLMLSRSLWCGDDVDGENGRTACCKVQPALLEFLFLNLDKKYVRYSEAANRARIEREKRGYYSCCRTGCYHDSCCNGRQLITKYSATEGAGSGRSSFFTNEDGYVFYPGYSQEYSHVLQYNRSTMTITTYPDRRVPEKMEKVQDTKKWRKTICDLFPEEFLDGSSIILIEDASRSDDVSLGVLEEGGESSDGHDEESNQSENNHENVLDEGHMKNSSPTEYNGNNDNDSHGGYTEFLSYIGVVEEGDPSSGHDEESKLSENNFETILEEGHMNISSPIEYNDSNDNDSLGVVEEGGPSSGHDEESKQSESNHENVLEEGHMIISPPIEYNGNNDKDSLGVVEDGGPSSGHDEESKQSENNHENILERNISYDFGVSGEGINVIESEEMSTRDSLKYPRRLVYLFLPPGFHNWTNAFEFVGYFFFIPGLYGWCHKKFERIPRLSQTYRKEDNSNNMPSNVPLSNPGKDLTEGEAELLRCAGLDTYLLLRLARFGFDVTWYPFLSACVLVLPIYLSASTDEKDFYLSLTIEVLPNNSTKIIWIVVFTILLYIYIMRRLWLEWEVFIKLRHDFLAEGDTSFHQRRTYLKKYRNTCLVECVPKTLRTDQSLKLAFETLFPGQIEHAEMLIDTSNLEKILRKRQKLIEKYDDIDACYRYEDWRYTAWQQGEKLSGCCSNKISKPEQPKVWIGGLFSGKLEKAFPYYDTKIKEMDQLADKEYGNIVKTRNKWRRESVLRSFRESEDTSAQFAIHNLYTLFVPSKVRSFFGEQPEFFSGTGVVTFKDIASKQSAVQCNLSGQPYHLVTDDAPDPRDIFWANIDVNRKNMESRKILVQSLLFLGVLGWGVIVTYIQKWITWITENMNNNNDSNFMGLVSGYLPALFISFILLWLPNLFLLLAMRVIRFKSHTKCDEFVLLWNTAYRLANIFFAFFSISLLQALECFRENPESYIRELSGGVIRQGAYLMNLIILATGQETMLQLLQWRSLTKQALFRPLINQNKKSRRYIEWLNAAPHMEESFLFGFYAPVLSYGLMIAMVFAFMAPIMLGVCSVFFWLATKVHMHNALFVYCQRCEGGGKLFYYWNRIVFIAIYSSIVIFSGILALKDMTELGIGLLFVMTLVTYCVDKSIENTFVIHSLHLPMSIARLHDEEEVSLLQRSNMKPDGGENFMYRHPILDQENWNSKPTWK